jgi:hypothetical protein
MTPRLTQEHQILALIEQGPDLLACGAHRPTRVRFRPDGNG